MGSFSRMLVITGLVLIVLGLVLQVAPSVPLLGKLPGDIRIERPGFRLYFPITTCLIISLLVSAALWLFSRGR